MPERWPQTALAARTCSHASRRLPRSRPSVDWRAPRRCVPVGSHMRLRLAPSPSSTGSATSVAYREWTDFLRALNPMALGLRAGTEDRTSTGFATRLKSDFSKCPGSERCSRIRDPIIGRSTHGPPFQGRHKALGGRCPPKKSCTPVARFLVPRRQRARNAARPNNDLLRARECQSTDKRGNVECRENKETLYFQRPIKR